MSKNWKSFLALLFGVVLIVFPLYRLTELLILQDFNDYNAGRIVGNGILLFSGFMIVRALRKKNRNGTQSA